MEHDGILETMGVKEAAMHAVGADAGEREHRTLVAPNLMAVNLDHYFSFRLNLDVDGPHNSLMIDRLVPEQITGGKPLAN